MPLISTSKSILNQLRELIIQLSDQEFYAEVDVLNGNTIGKHVRHIIEFFDLLMLGYAVGAISYDQRKHDYQLETHRETAIAKLGQLVKQLDGLQLGKPLVLYVNYSTNNQESIALNSSVDREIAYNIEHAIHHMAIIKIAVKMLFPGIKLPDHFGVAYSTVRYQGSLSENRSTA